jgi:hypothetical protein
MDCPKCGTLCPYFKPRKGEYKPRGVCGLPSAPKYVIIDGEREEPPKWCLRKEKAREMPWMQSMERW